MPGSAPPRRSSTGTPRTASRPTSSISARRRDMSTAPKVPKNPPPLKPGMDNPWYDYAPYPKRPLLTWPKNARVAFCVVLPLEYYELQPDDKAVKDGRFIGEFGNY